MKNAISPDRLNETVGVLVRREVEVRLLIPLLAALGDEFGKDKVMKVFARTIEDIAREQGRETALRLGDNSLASFEASLEAWTRGGAMERLPIETGEKLVRFDVTRCRYAEMYRELGATDIGFLFSCVRDRAWMEGFNPAVRMTRTRTIMQGESRCDFCYELTEGHVPPESVDLPTPPVASALPEKKAKNKWGGMYAMDIDMPETKVTIAKTSQKKRPDTRSGQQSHWKTVGYLLIIVLLLVGLYMVQFGIQRYLLR